ncbi:GNAT family acetyltransferase [Bacteriovorax sp. DB6_IX]|uniref:GNAT family acetyltransferase n=1 Tax=Bacteriovorax sp. DB6_IX TaxID=1353530 RepID=UPI00038A22EA|nr:GNAT family acetyltransferase [Bacteriovorax sp. DB6_IX]EQC52051.1 acetyltransferase (GNAT) domain protein [Bacteriovorax sp. DB6_IX]
MQGNAVDLSFVEVTKDTDIKNVYEFNIDAFSDSPDFKWTVDDIRREVKDGWKLYSVNLGEEIIAAAFCKLESKELHCKNTSIKMQHQGSGFSHRIMDYFERKADELKAKKIIHYCAIDNFRQYSLNESHGYVKTDRKLGLKGHTTEWIKDI